MVYQYFLCPVSRVHWVYRERGTISDLFIVFIIRHGDRNKYPQFHEKWRNPWRARVAQKIYMSVKLLASTSPRFVFSQFPKGKTRIFSNLNDTKIGIAHASLSYFSFVRVPTGSFWRVFDLEIKSAKHNQHRKYIMFLLLLYDRHFVYTKEYNILVKAAPLSSIFFFSI